MPIQPSYPGVYVQEISSGVRTITGVSTSIGAFFGRTAKGPINRAVRCLSYLDFLREFGGAHPLSDLATSVRQFFDNGGGDCYVVRIANGATAAEVTLRRLPSGDANGNVLTAKAKAEGLWGQDIKLDVDYNTPNPDDTFNLRVSYETNNTVIASEYHQNLSMNPASPRFAPAYVTQSSKLINLSLHTDGASAAGDINKTPAGYSQSRRVFTGKPEDIWKAINDLISGGKNRFIINVNGTKDIEIILTAAATKNNIDDMKAWLENSINNQLSGEIAGLAVQVSWDSFITPLPAAKDPQTGILRITSDFADKSGVKIRRAASGDIAAGLMLGLDQGGIEVGRYSNLRPVSNGTYFWGGKTFGNFTSELDGFTALSQAAVKKITVGSTIIDCKLETVTTGTPSMYEQAGGGFDGVREKLQIIAQAINANVSSPATAELWGYHLVLKKKTGGINETVTISSGPTDLSGKFVANARRYSLGILGTGGTFQADGSPGDDGNPPIVDTYTGNALKHTGFYALDRVDLFNLMIIPGDREISESQYRQLFGPASTYCYNRRAFLLLDAPASWTDGETMKSDAAAVNDLRAGIVKDHTAIFYPRVKFSDGGLIKPIGASGMIAGLMARTDSQRGVWKAPAGTEADLRGVLDVELNLTDLENGVLNKLGVNCIRKFPNGIVNWGARTLDGSDDFGSEWKYIPIRRLALFLEESLYRGTKWVVFEPNDEPLWAKIRMNLNAFMNGLFRQGAFQGSTPDKAFFVKCDAETTTQNDRNLGIVNIQVGFAPLKPAEFVIITIQQMKGDLV